VIRNLDKANIGIEVVVDRRAGAAANLHDRVKLARDVM
jgi:hypothetical protein